MAEEKKTYKFVCTVCGYEVEVDTPELPEDYVCPVCDLPHANRFDPLGTEENGSRLLLADPVCRESGRPLVLICNI